MIDPETAKRWWREAEELDPNGEDSFLAGRPTPILPEHLVAFDDLRRQRRLDHLAVVAHGLSLLGIAVAALTGSAIGLAAAGAASVVGLIALLVAVRSRHAFQRRVEKLRRPTAPAAG